mmetsp:Transcript_62888/g.73179  ORF Transcript_62888/g.73179 Transcript_62888/m.73179 type:complete len:437 (-) Transcript_62888:33-1343(-)|eukprot:CAMPEP_0176435670 /NCGR_PEP_ID=MMETSP0127-20121128/17474_1 /TAXON_ID=938130 /ORGANISM="Platyophrya macrostoma, Strain WH" /LENGTH=436 /DNA_ID=CAMNT_0017818769 /DNA_START=26 /DNA_END=1336 /DNA_ORIENTATION=-
MPKTSLSSATSTSGSASGSGSAKKDVPTNKHGGKDPWKAIIDQQTKAGIILMAKEKEKRDQKAKAVKAELTMMSIEKDYKKNQETAQKNKEGQEMMALRATHAKELIEKKEKEVKTAKALTGELLLQRARSVADIESAAKISKKLDDEMVKASKEAFHKQLEVEKQKKSALKNAVIENNMEHQVRKLIKQEQEKEDNSAHKKQIEQTIKTQLQKEAAQKEYFKKISQKQERRQDAFAEQVYYNQQTKERDYNSNLEKQINERQNEQNKKFLESIKKDKQAKNAIGAELRSQMGVSAQEKTFERNEYSKKVSQSHTERQNYISDLAMEQQDKLKKQKAYKLALDQQTFNSKEKRRNADDMTEHELKMNQKAIDAYVNGDVHTHHNLPGYSTVPERRINLVVSRRDSLSSNASGSQSTKSQGGKKPIINPITGVASCY